MDPHFWSLNVFEVVGALTLITLGVRTQTTYEPATVSAIMSAVLVRDVCDEHGLSRAGAPHPLALVVDGAWHGGMWTAGC